MKFSKLSSRPSMAVFQIAVLVVGIFAFAYAFSSSLPSVSAQDSSWGYDYRGSGSYLCSPGGSTGDFENEQECWSYLEDNEVDGNLYIVVGPDGSYTGVDDSVQDVESTIQDDDFEVYDGYSAFESGNSVSSNVEGTDSQETQQTSSGGGEVADGNSCNVEGTSICYGGDAFVCDGDQKPGTTWVRVSCGQGESCFEGECVESMETTEPQTGSGQNLDTENPASSSNALQKGGQWANLGLTAKQLCEEFGGPICDNNENNNQNQQTPSDGNQGGGQDGTGDSEFDGGSDESYTERYGPQGEQPSRPQGTGDQNSDSEGAIEQSGFFGNIGGFFGDVGRSYGGQTGGSIASSSYIFASASAALGAAQVYKWVFSLAGAGERNLRGMQGAALGTAAAAASLQIAIEAGALQSLAASPSAAGFGTQGAAGISAFGSTSAFTVFGLGAIAVMGVYTALSYQTYSQHTYQYQVSSWQPEFGGEQCTQCNELRYGCSEYQCKTFGRGCELVNQGTQQERCTWTNEDDLQPPVMSPMNSSLDVDQEYQPMDTEVPDDRGVQITNSDTSDGCLPAFSGAELGVNTNELAECKVDLERKSYENMTSYFSQGTSLVKNHTLTIPGAAMPSESSGEASGLNVENGEMNRYYVQCKDVNGNPTPNHMVMGFCVDEGPDTTAPVIEGTNYLDDSYISHNETTVPLEVYTNEPADCRWSRTDLGYEQMENNMSQCSQNVQDYLIDSSFQYGCSGNLSGIQNGEANDYFIKCKDKPWLEGQEANASERRIANRESFDLTLQGTDPLVIRNVTVNDRPNGTTIRDSTDSIKAKLEVETAAGADRGRARCSYEMNGNSFRFYNNGTTGFVQGNTQDLYLSEDNYQVPIECVDEGGNIAESMVSFTIDQDNAQPQVTRAYRDSENLRILTNEPSECVYNTNANLGCTYNFEDGVEMEQVDGQTHYTEWEPSTRYYMKCRDEFGNKPAPSQCSVTVRAYDI